MSENKEKNVVATVFWVVVGLIVAGIAIFGFSKALMASEDNKDFRAVCTYEGGRIEGDVCVKGNTIVLTQDQWKERAK